MKKAILIIICIAAGNLAFCQKCIQFSPFSLETAENYGESRIKASPVFRLFYEFKFHKRFAIIGGFGYLANHVTIPVKCCDQNYGDYDQKQAEFQIGLKYFLGKQKRRIIPYLEQDIFYKKGSSKGKYGGGGIGGSAVTEMKGKGQSFGTRSRIGVEYNISKSVFISLNSGLALGFGKNVHIKNEFVQFSLSPYTEPNYGSNIILSEFRIGYRL